MDRAKLLTPQSFRDARRRLLQMHFESGVGHIGGNLSALDTMLVMFNEHLTAQDHFILSKGHSAGALYIALWSAGLLKDEDLTSFHKDDTLLAGHPPARGIAQIPFATGSLGHGLSLAAGTAKGLLLKKDSARVVCLTSDGEWQEGSTWEALIFACHHKLSNLTVLVDHNDLQGFGGTAEVASMSPLWEKLTGFDLDVRVIDGHDPDAIRGAIGTDRNRPRMVILRTTKGKGVGFMEGRMDSHYLPLTEDKYRLAMKDLEAR